MKNNMKYFSSLLVFIILMTSCNPDVTEKTNFNPDITEKPVTGEWIAKNYPKTLLADRPIAIAGKNVYQFKVLAQGTNECYAHAPRNIIYMTEMLKKSQNEYSKHYDAMVNENLYEKYFSALGCIKGNRGHGQFINNPYYFNIFKKLVESGELPKDTQKYEKDTFEYTWLNGNDGDDKRIEVLRKFIEAHEKHDKKDYQKFAEYAYAAGDNFNEDFAKFQHVIQQDHGIFGFNVTVYTTMRHAVALILRKNKNNTEYFFADSFNSSPDKKTNYESALKILITFIQDPQVLEKSLIRYKTNRVYQEFDMRKDYENSLPYEFIKNYIPAPDDALAKDKLYTDIYRPAIKRMVESHKIVFYTSDDSYNKTLALFK